MDSIARVIDHTLLKPDAVPAQVDRLCAEAREHGFKSVCINPCHVPQAAKLLAGFSIDVCTVIGFPLGATSSRAKAAEAETAVEQGATEFDMVMNVGLFKAGEGRKVARAWYQDGMSSEITAITSAATTVVAMIKRARRTTPYR